MEWGRGYIYILRISIIVLILLESFVFCAIITDTYKAVNKCQGTFINYFHKLIHLVLMQPYKLGTINSFGLQLKKLGLREIECHAQSHRGIKYYNQRSNLG